MLSAIQLKNQVGAVAHAPTGFSFTTLFFGPFPALFRSDFKGFVMLILLYIVGLVVIAWFVMPFIYNKMYIKSLQKQGFVPIDEHAKDWLLRKGLYMAESNA